MRSGSAIATAGSACSAAATATMSAFSAATVKWPFAVRSTARSCRTSTSSISCLVAPSRKRRSSVPSGTKGTRSPEVWINRSRPTRCARAAQPFARRLDGVLPHLDDVEGPEPPQPLAVSRAQRCLHRDLEVAGPLRRRPDSNLGRAPLELDDSAAIAEGNKIGHSRQPILITQPTRAELQSVGSIYSIFIRIARVKSRAA